MGGGMGVPMQLQYLAGPTDPRHARTNDAKGPCAHVVYTCDLQVVPLWYFRTKVYDIWAHGL